MFFGQNSHAVDQTLEESVQPATGTFWRKLAHFAAMTTLVTTSLIGCKNGSGDDTVPLQVTPDAPAQVVQGTQFDLGFDVEGADGPVDASIQLIYEGGRVENIEDVFTPTRPADDPNQLELAFPLQATELGALEVIYEFTDTGDDNDVRDGRLEIQITAQPNDPAQLSFNFDETPYVGDQLELPFQAVDGDGTTRLVVYENDADSTVFLPGGSTDFTGTVTRTFTTPQNVEYTVRQTDSQEAVTTASYTLQVQAADNTPSTITLTTEDEELRVGETLTLDLGVQDADIIDEIGVDSYIQGTTDTTRTSFDPNATTFNTELTETLDETGTLVYVVAVTDNKGETRTQNFSFTILPEQVMRTLTLDMVVNGQPAVGVDGIIRHNGEVVNQGESNSQGQYIFTVTEDAGNPLTYQAEFDEVGLANNQLAIRTNQTVTMTALPITFNGTALQNIRPRQQGQQESLEGLVNLPEDVAAVTSLLTTGNNIDFAKLTEFLYSFSTTQQDPANVTENFTLEVCGPWPGQVATTTLSKFVPERALALFTETSRELQQGSSIVYTDIRDIIDVPSFATVDSVAIIPGAGLTVDKNGTYGFTFTADTEGMVAVTYRSFTNEGGVNEQQGMWTLTGLPKSDFTVQGTDFADMRKSYLLLKDDGVVVDSLVSESGMFTDVAIPAGVDSVVVAQLDGLDQHYSAGHKIAITPGDDYIIPVLNRTNLRFDEASKQVLADGDMSIDLITDIIEQLRVGYANGTFDGFNQDNQVDGNFQNNLPRYRTSENGVNANRYIIPRHLIIQFRGQNGEIVTETHDLEQETLDNAVDIYQNYIVPIVGAGAPELVIQDTLTYRLFDQPKNDVFLFARGNIAPDFGRYNQFSVRTSAGGLPGDFYTSFSSIRSGSPDGRATNPFERHAILEENASQFLWKGKFDALFSSTMTFKDLNGSEFTIYAADMKAGRFTNNSYFQATESFDDAVIIPPEWK